VERGSGWGARRARAAPGIDVLLGRGRPVGQRIPTVKFALRAWSPRYDLFHVFEGFGGRWWTKWAHGFWTSVLDLCIFVGTFVCGRME